MINIAYEFVNTELNKDQRSKIRPVDFNVVARASQANVVEHLLEKIRQTSYKELRGVSGSGLASQLEYSEQIVEYYLKTEPLKPLPKADGRGGLPIPKDSRGLTILYTQDGTEVEKVTKIEFHRLVSTKHGNPSKCYPVYYRVGDSVFVCPQQKEVFATYVRIPKTPKWTYTVVNDIPIYDPSKSDFQNLDIPYELFPDFLREVLRLCGLSIRENEIVSYLQAEEQIGFQKEQ